MTSRPVWLAVAIAAALGALACSSAETLSDRACPPSGTKLTYDNFGRDFFGRWCLQCHGAGNGYSSRSFTTVDAIRSERDRIFVNAAADNTTMPPGPDDPPKDDREKLAEWLACGAP